MDNLDEMGMLTLTAAGGGYDGVTDEVAVTVVDTAGLVVSRTGLSLPEESVLVGNSGQSGDQSATYSSDHGQAFTTGNNSNGYAVSSVTIISEDPENDPIDLKICEVDGGGAPTEDCTDLTPPNSFARGSPLVFTVPDDSPLTLAPGTTHMVVFKTPNSGTVRVDATSNDSEDNASLPGWSIRNSFQWKSSTGWRDGSGGRAIRIVISGTVAGLVVAEGATGTYTVALGTEPSADVTVTVSGQAGTDVSLNKTSLTFTTTNWAAGQTVTVTAAHDTNAVDDVVTLTHTAASPDTDYEGLTLDMAVTVDDDDTPVVLVSNSGQSGNQSVTYSSEHGQAFTTGDNSNDYTVDSVTIISEDPNTDPIDLKICEVDGGGAPTEDCTDLTPPASFPRGSLVFTVPDDSPLTLAPGTTHMVVFKTPGTAAVQVAATNSDSEDQGSLPGWSIRNSFQWNSTTGWQNGSGGRSIRIIINGAAIADEVAGVTIVPDTGLPVDEGDTGTYTVVLDSEPSGDVTVTAASADVGAVTVSPATLTFTSTNWATAQTVTVTAVQDLNADDETVDVLHTAVSSADAAYNSLTVAVVTVTVTDDEVAAGVTIVPDTGLRVDEGDTATYTVVLDSQPSGDVTVTAASADVAAVTVSPATLTFTSTNWATAQTVTVRAVDDDDASDETVTVSHGMNSTADAAYNAVTADSGDCRGRR